MVLPDAKSVLMVTVTVPETASKVSGVVKSSDAGVGVGSGVGVGVESVAAVGRSQCPRMSSQLVRLVIASNANVKSLLNVFISFFLSDRLPMSGFLNK